MESGNSALCGDSLDSSCDLCFDFFCGCRENIFIDCPLAFEQQVS